MIRLIELIPSSLNLFIAFERRASARMSKAVGERAKRGAGGFFLVLSVLHCHTPQRVFVCAVLAVGVTCEVSMHGAQQGGYGKPYTLFRAELSYGFTGRPRRTRPRGSHVSCVRFTVLSTC